MEEPLADFDWWFPDTVLKELAASLEKVLEIEILSVLLLSERGIPGWAH